MRPISKEWSLSCPPAWLSGNTSFSFLHSSPLLLRQKSPGVLSKSPEVDCRAATADLGTRSGYSLGLRVLTNSSTRLHRTRSVLMQSSHRCNWDWCRETFITERGLAQHLNEVHFKNIAVVKKEDWHVWVKTQTGQSQPGAWYSLELHCTR